MKKKYTFVLNFGYAESASVSYMPFSSEVKFNDAKDALIDLAKFLKERFIEANKIPDIDPCCKASLSKDDKSKYCSNCGKSLEEDEFNEEHFTDWLRELSSQDMDSITEYLPYNIVGARWESTDLEGAVNQRFVYQAEWVLAAASGYNHNCKIDFETICQERTKNKKTSFTYY